MRRRRRAQKTPEQIERKRMKALEALHRHRELRREQKAAIGIRRQNAIRNVNTAIQEMVFGKNGRTRNTTHTIARELFFALGPDAAAKVVEHLNAEFAIPTEERQREQKELAQWMASAQEVAA